MGSLRHGTLIAVTGPGGTGSSTTAIALAQGLSDLGHQGHVVLVDLALHAELAVLHDARELSPGIQELVEANRIGRASTDDAISHTFDVRERGYHLLLGLRRAQAWPTVPPRAFAATLETLRLAYRFVVCDVTADFEGEAEGGSIDVEERNTMSRGAALSAEAIVVVGRRGRKGLHSLARVVNDLVELGIDPACMVPVLVGSELGHRDASDRSSALASLPATAGMPSPVHLPERSADAALASCSRLHPSLTRPLVERVRAVLEEAPRLTAASRRRATQPQEHEPQRVLPGTLGRLRPSDLVFGLPEHAGS